MAPATVLDPPPFPTGASLPTGFSWPMTGHRGGLKQVLPCLWWTTSAWGHPTGLAKTLVELHCSLGLFLPNLLPCPSPSQNSDLRHSLQVLPALLWLPSLFPSQAFPPVNPYPSNHVLVSASQKPWPNTVVILTFSPSSWSLNAGWGLPSGLHLPPSLPTTFVSSPNLKFLPQGVDTSQRPFCFSLFSTTTCSICSDFYVPNLELKSINAPQETTCYLVSLREVSTVELCFSVTPRHSGTSSQV